MGAVLAATLAVSCVGAPTRPPAARPAGAPCTAAVVRSCALPYPSDEFTVVDRSTGTGRRLAVPPDLINPALVAQLGPGASPADVFGGADGFAALTPVVFEFDRAVDRSSLLADGAAAVAVFDAANGRRIPVRVDLPVETLRQGAPGTVVMVWPRIRWEFGHTYVARVDDRLRAASFGTLHPTLDVMGARGPFLSGIKADLRRFEGDRWSRVLTVTRFTVRSRADATRRLDVMAAAARAAAHPVRNLAVDRSVLVPNAAAVVTGEVQLTDFRDDRGVLDPALRPRPTWERFLLVLPARPARSDGAPVVVYGHGISVSKETMLISAGSDARAGFATIGIDVPNHGDRQADEGGYVFDLTSPQQLGRLAAMAVQGEVDQVSLVRAVTTSLRSLDLAGRTGTSGPVPDGRPDLDTSHLLYVGTSMGGVLGTSSVALVPEFRGALLQVAGTGISDIIYHSLIWPVFAGVVPSGGPAGDALALMGAAAMLLDTADNVNVVDRIRARGTPVLLVYGTGDAIVPNFASERLVRLLQLPVVGPAPVEVEGASGAVAADRVPADRRGAVQIDADGLRPSDPGFGGHLVFSSDRATRYLDEWLSAHLAAFTPRA